MTKAELRKARERFSDMSKIISASTVDSLHRETPEEQEKRIKHLLKPQNYSELFDYYFGLGTPVPLADSQCAPFHLKSYKELYANPFIFQMRRWFRGSAKSVHSNIGNAFALKQSGLMKFMVQVGINELRAKMLLSDIQAQLQYNERIIKDFGNQVAYGDWADGDFDTKDGTHFMALGLSQPFRGLRSNSARPDYAVVDDCEDREVALNKARVQKNGEKILGDLKEAGSKNAMRIVVANNYIVRKGLLDYLMDKQKHLPSFKDSVVNIYDKNGKPSWPERYTQADVDDKKANTAFYFWERELMNNPVEEGKLIKEKWTKFGRCKNIRSWDGLIIHWDLSYVKNGDYKAGALVGFKNGVAYVLDVFCRQVESNTAMDWHYNLIKRMTKKGQAPYSYYDATVAQGAVFGPKWRKAAKDHQVYIHPIPLSAPGVDKHLRIEITLVSMFFSGQIVFNEDLKGTPDFDAAKDQLLSFEKGTSSPDDFPDTLECAIRQGQKIFSDGDQETGLRKPIIIEIERTGF